MFTNIEVQITHKCWFLRNALVVHVNSGSQASSPPLLDESSLAAGSVIFLFLLTSCFFRFSWACLHFSVLSSCLLLTFTCHDVFSITPLVCQENVILFNFYNLHCINNYNLHCIVCNIKSSIQTFIKLLLMKFLLNSWSLSVFLNATIAFNKIFQLCYDILHQCSWNSGFTPHCKNIINCLLWTTFNCLFLCIMVKEIQSQHISRGRKHILRKLTTWLTN